MKITNYENVANLYKTNQKQNVKNKEVLNKAQKINKNENTKTYVDNVELSPEALLLQKVKMAIKETPDVREDKVREIKNKIQSGEYNVTTEMLVEKLLSGK